MVVENKREKREGWIDNVKVLACFLVLTGHLMQSMVKSDIIPVSHLYKWFNMTIYYFHVPLFFICSGYLYQSRSVVRTFGQWKSNVLGKFVALGIPYFTFSIITYVIKTVMSSSVNTQNSGLLKTLFIEPASPYWYLYVLFFMFMLIPTVSTKESCYVYVTIALACRIAVIFIPAGWSNIYILEKILLNTIWFATGMGMSFLKIPVKIKNMRMATYKTAVFSVKLTAIVGLSIVIYMFGMSKGIVPFVMGVLFCETIIVFFICSETGDFVTKLSGRWVMPVFLMHTIFAAGIRIVITKVMGGRSLSGTFMYALIHVVLGMVFSIMGPIIAAYIADKSRLMKVFIYPTKVINLKKTESSQEK
ncbi:MAG: acyltransferase [Lachnospiraceae bacterium]|nr:acyltransferase [Lachnospiraceae bacterium]